MKDEIKILFLKNVGNYLDGEVLKYLVKESDGEKYIVTDFPSVYNEPLNSIYNNICYDFDELSIPNQQRYQKYYIQLKRVNKNIYSAQTKTYQIKRNLFT